MIKEVRTQDTQKIKGTIIQLKTKLLEYKFQLSQGNFTTVNLIKDCRKTIARLMTVLSERNEKLINKDWKIFMENNKKELEINKKTMIVDSLEDVVPEKVKKEVKNENTHPETKLEDNNIAKEELTTENTKTSTKNIEKKSKTTKKTSE